MLEPEDLVQGSRVRGVSGISVVVQKGPPGSGIQPSLVSCHLDFASRPVDKVLALNGELRHGCMASTGAYRSLLSPNLHV